MIHLVGHALFKSVLFMALGILLHMVGQQDSRAIPSVVYSEVRCVYYVVVGGVQ